MEKKIDKIREKSMPKRILDSASNSLSKITAGDVALGVGVVLAGALIGAFVFFTLGAGAPFLGVLASAVHLTAIKGGIGTGIAAVKGGVGTAISHPVGAALGLGVMATAVGATESYCINNRPNSVLVNGIDSNTKTKATEDKSTGDELTEGKEKGSDNVTDNVNM